MPLPYSKVMIPRAKELQKNMTAQERKLWFLFLRNHPVKFQRQKTISSFIVDFYCSKALLAVEIDGAPHFTEHGIAYVKERTGILQGTNVDIIRFNNNDIDYRFEDVCGAIDEKVKQNMKKQHK